MSRDDGVVLDQVAQWRPFFLFCWKGSPKLNQPKQDALFSYGHWASELRLETPMLGVD